MAYWNWRHEASLGKKVRLATLRWLLLHRMGSMVAYEFHARKESGKYSYI